MTVVDKVCPNGVGGDIGCGMYTVKLADTEMHFEKIDEVCTLMLIPINMRDGSRDFIE